MKYFVTGGAGFIGSHIVDRLFLQGSNYVTVYDNLSSGKIEFLKQHFERYDFNFIHGDLLDFSKLKSALQDYDMVFHLASNPDIAKSVKQPELDLKQGIIATFNVLEAMRLNDIKKIVYTSGSGVYGDVGKTFTDESFGPLLPISMYGASKLSCEALISAYCHLYGIQTWIFRLANIVGPRQTHGVVLDFIKKLKKNPYELEILGNGEQSKSYLYIDDCINAIFLAIRKANKKVNVFNVATLDYIPVNEIAKIVCEEMGLKNVRYKYTGGNRGWIGDVPHVRLNITKITKLGWKPRFSSKKAIKRAVKEILYSTEK
jgi:UDP-glucose 4-epimerase